MILSKYSEPDTFAGAASRGGHSAMCYYDTVSHNYVLVRERYSERLGGRTLIGVPDTAHATAERTPTLGVRKGGILASEALNAYTRYSFFPGESSPQECQI